METNFGLHTIGTTRIKGYKSDFIPNAHYLDKYWSPGESIEMYDVIDFTGL
jgi:hypothetical protein